jgi:C4-dicarboxylate transporter DctM subunit
MARRIHLKYVNAENCTKCFLGWFARRSIILIMAPMYFPAAINTEVGLCHPSVGLNLYVASGIAQMGITELTKSVQPWLLTMVVFLITVTYWPWLSLVVPRMLGML